MYKKWVLNNKDCFHWEFNQKSFLSFPFLICFAFFFCSNNKRRQRPDLPLPATTHVSLSGNTQSKRPPDISPSNKNTESKRLPDGSPSSSSIVLYSIPNKSTTTTARSSSSRRLPFHQYSMKRPSNIFNSINTQQNAHMWQQGVVTRSISDTQQQQYCKRKRWLKTWLILKGPETLFQKCLQRKRPPISSLLAILNQNPCPMTPLPAAALFVTAYSTNLWQQRPDLPLPATTQSIVIAMQHASP